MCDAACDKKQWMTVAEIADRTGIPGSTWRYWARTDGIMPGKWKKRVASRWYIHRDVVTKMSLPVEEVGHV